MWADKINYLAEQPGIDVLLITTDQCGQPFGYPLSPRVRHIDLGGIRYHSIYHHPYPRRFLDIHRFQKDFRERVIPVLKREKPDVTIANTSFCPELIAGLPYAGVKVLEVHTNYLFTLKAGPKHKGEMPWWQYTLKTLFDKMFLHSLKRYDELVTLTQEDCKDWSRHRHAVCIPNPLTRFPEETHDGVERKHIIAVGRLYGQKGFDLLAEAWAKIAKRHPEWRITIFGDGNEKAVIEACIRRLGVEDSLTIHPSVANIYKEYLQSDFLVLSSRVEGFGLVLIEAMSCGIPCVSFNCPLGPGEIISDGVDGLLARNGDVAHLSEQMEYMITHPEERRKMGKAALIKAQQYDKEEIMQHWMQLFKELIAGK